MENNNEKKSKNNKNIEYLKLYLVLFNTFILLDDIFLHYSSINFLNYYFQLVSAEIIIFYLWLSIRKPKIKINRQYFLYYTSFHSLFSIIYCIQQLFSDSLNYKNAFKTILFHQIIHILIPICLILYIVYILKNVKTYPSINMESDALNLMEI